MMRHLLFVPFLFLPACDGSSPASKINDTSTFALGSIGVTLTVTSNGAAALLDARITSSSSAMLRLAPSDVLSASATDAPSRPLAEYAPGKYVLLLTTQAPSIDLVFSRVGKVVSTTTLPLPTPFVVTPPSPAVRSQGLSFGWAAGKADETLALEFAGPCVAGMKQTRSPDPLGTTFTLQAADFSTTTGACTLDIDVKRSLSKPVPLTNFAPSAGATLVQTRSLEIATQP